MNVQNLKGLYADNKQMMEKIERYRTAQKNGLFGTGKLYYNSINALKTNIEALEKKRAENNAAKAGKIKNVENLRNKYSSNEYYNAIKKHINKFEKGGWRAPKTKEEVETQISKNRELAFEKRQKEAEKKEREKKENNEWKNKPTRPTLTRSGPINENVANNKVNSVKRIELANKVKKYIKNNNVKTLETNRIVEKIIAGSITNYNKAILEVNKEIKKKQPSNNKANGETNLLAKFNKTGQHERLKLFKKQAGANKAKKEAEEALAKLEEQNKKQEESNRKAKEAANKLAEANKKLTNFKKAVLNILKI